MLADFQEMPVQFIIFAVIGYLFGSLNFSIIVSRYMMGVDIRNLGSKNAGLTNALRSLGPKAAVITVLGDVLKALPPILIAKAVAGEDAALNAAMLAGLCCIMGHIKPVFFGFKGGKGVLTSAAVVGFLNWPCLVIMLIVFFIVLAVSRYVSVASVLCAVTFPMAAYVTSMGNKFFFCFAVIIGLYIIIMHKDNLIRLSEGREPKFNLRKKMQPEQAKPENEENVSNG